MNLDTNKSNHKSSPLTEQCGHSQKDKDRIQNKGGNLEHPPHAQDIVRVFYTQHRREGTSSKTVIDN